MDDADCRRERLAGTAGLVVDQCTCGCVHLTIGAMTLRLQADGVVEVANVLQQAVIELQRRRSAPRRRLASVLPS
jgi:hypothetical protein